MPIIGVSKVPLEKENVIWIDENKLGKSYNYVKMKSKVKMSIG
jgi:hypothetical protein